MKCSVLSLLFILSGMFLSGFAQTTDTTFIVGGSITNYRPDKTIYLAMFSCPEDFKQRKHYKTLRFPGDQLPSDSLRYTFTGVEQGEYIIAVYQDRNGDGKMNMGIFGPKEPYRIYKPNYGIFGPKFSKCKFTVDCDIDTAYIALK